MGAGGGTGIGGSVGGGGIGDCGGSGTGKGAVRVFVNVHTTTSPLAIAPSTFVPGTETAGWPFRVQSTFEL